MGQCAKISTPASRRQEIYQKYNRSEKGRACRERTYARFGGEAAYHRMKRIRLSEEMDCTQYEVDSLLLGYRFMEALQTIPREKG